MSQSASLITLVSDFIWMKKDDVYDTSKRKGKNLKVSLRCRYEFPMSHVPHPHVLKIGGQLQREC